MTQRLHTLQIFEYILGNNPVDVFDERIAGCNDISFYYLNCPARGVYEDENIGVNILEPQWESQILSQLNSETPNRSVCVIVDFTMVI